MSRGKLLLTGPRMLRDIDMVRPRLLELGFELVIAEVRQSLSEEELLPLVGDIDATICGGDAWTARVMDAAPKLKAICKWGTGIDAIDQDAARERGILVRNVPDAFSVPVADSVMCFMLNFARRIPWLTRELQAGRWTPLDGTSLAECTLGVVGVGNIGSTVLRRARAFGMTLLATDPKPDIPLQLLDDTGVEMVELDELLERSDFVSLNCDLNPTTRHLIGRRELGLMKPTAVLINTSRGPVVDQKALESCLVEGGIAGAGLDVYEAEPIDRESPLLTLENVLLSPHLAQSSDRAAHRVHWITIRNVVELLEQSEGRR
ncbi:MAG TPA: dihydrofolate reductase [Phycisphaerales bacterium]|nr:dihydrofolate reductase [Phycisphaerales bacterium]